MITELKPNQVFVFGSNLAGRHGKGAALTAKKKFGAIYGKGIGHHGQSYAIPTKDENIRTMPLYRIRVFIGDFMVYALRRHDLEFLVTPIGCGLAGYRPYQIAPYFWNAPPNVKLPKNFNGVSSVTTQTRSQVNSPRTPAIYFPL